MREKFNNEIAEMLAPLPQGFISCCIFYRENVDNKEYSYSMTVTGVTYHACISLSLQAAERK